MTLVLIFVTLALVVYVVNGRSPRRRRRHGREGLLILGTLGVLGYLAARDRRRSLPDDTFRRLATARNWYPGRSPMVSVVSRCAADRQAADDQALWEAHRERWRADPEYRWDYREQRRETRQQG